MILCIVHIRNMRSTQIHKIRTHSIKTVALFLVFIVCVIGIAASLQNVFNSFSQPYSVLLYNSEGSTIFFAEPKTALQYALIFKKDTYILVPGGYGPYKQSALLRLSEIEKKEKIVINAFTYTVKTPITYIFKPDKPQEKLTISTLLFAKSNANFLNRLLLSYQLLSIQSTKTLDIPTRQVVGNEQVDADKLKSIFASVFLNANLRNAPVTVAIVYSKSAYAAQTISTILEDIGIKMRQSEKKEHTRCEIKASESSITTTVLERLLHCPLVFDRSKGQNIDVFLGEEEKERQEK
jgi:hypothetical protein